MSHNVSLVRLSSIVLLAIGLTIAYVSTGFPFLGARPPGEDGSSNAPAEPCPAVVCFGHVDVEQGVQTLVPLSRGRIVEVRVRENQTVKAGDVLLRLEDSEQRLRLQETEAEEKVMQARLAQAQDLLKQHPAKLAEHKHVIEAGQSRLAAARNVLARKTRFQRQNLIDVEEVNAASDTVNELQAMLRVEQEKFRSLELHNPSLAVQEMEEAVSMSRARVAQARTALEVCNLCAPADGEILRLLAAPGDVIGSQGRPVRVVFCPQQPRIVRAEVPQEFADELRVGKAAIVQDDTQSCNAWHGHIGRISDWYTHRRSQLQEPLEKNDVRTLECVIQMDPGQPHLRIGQRMRVLIYK